jgi:predicted nucleic acid-binding Zn ribbon protein
MPERRRGPRALSEVIGRVRPRLAPPTLLAAVQDRWADAAGEQVSRQARPVSEKGAVVTVSCRSATWASELSLLSGELLERLNSGLPEGVRVKALRFVIEPE